LVYVGAGHYGSISSIIGISMVNLAIQVERILVPFSTTDNLVIFDRYVI